MVKLPKANLFDAVPKKLPHEWFQTLIESGDIKIERIVSQGHASAAGAWYDQDWDEWVAVLKGSAGLRLEGHDEVLCLAPGDWLLIPAHVKHQVAWTDAGGETVWLAVHFRAAEKAKHGE